MGQRRSRRDDRGERHGMSGTAIILLVVGGVTVMSLLACGGLIFLGYNRGKEQIEQERRAKEQADRELQEMARAIEAAGNGLGQIPRGFILDGVPAPKPGSPPVADPPPQPKPAPFDKAEAAGRWRVLFRSKDPALWNTNTQRDDDFAIPLQCAPEAMRYVRLRRMDTGEAIIISLQRSAIGQAAARGPRVRWNGEGKDEYGGYHLGIAEGPVARFMEGMGTIGVLMDGFDANPGSGFGHAHHIENGGQRYSWLGKEIPETAFEVAITESALTDDERQLFRE